MDQGGQAGASWTLDVALATSRSRRLDVCIPSLAAALVDAGPVARAWVHCRSGRLIADVPAGTGRAPVRPADHPILGVEAACALAAGDGERFDALAAELGFEGGVLLIVPVEGFGYLQLHGVTPALAAELPAVADLVRRLVARAEPAAPDRIASIPHYFFEDIVECLPSMVFVKDAATLRFALVNRVAESLLGYGREDLLGRSDYDFFPKSEADFFTANDRQVLATGLPQDILEEPIHTKHGDRYLHTKKIPLMDEDGQPAYLLGISEDVTEQRTAERQLAQLHADLEERVRVRTAELQVAYQELESFVHAVSHDLRGPVRVVHSFAEILRVERADVLGDGLQWIDGILSACGRLETLFEAILAMARISSAPIEPAQVALSELAASIAAQACQVHPRQVSIFIEPDMTCTADAAMLELLLENLIGNALKFSAEAVSPRIEIIAVASAPDTWCVRDNGVGFDQSHADRLFVPFQRLHAAAQFAGTGIGLATAARIVHRHGGKIWAESKPGRGASFFFNFPSAERAEPIGGQQGG